MNWGRSCCSEQYKRYPVKNITCNFALKEKHGRGQAIDKIRVLVFTASINQ